MNTWGTARGFPLKLSKRSHTLSSTSLKGDVNSLPAKLLLDTGASQTILIYSPFVEKNKLLETTNGTVKLAAGGLGGGNLIYKGRAKAVRVGNIVFENPLIDFSTTRGAADRRDG